MELIWQIPFIFANFRVFVVDKDIDSLNFDQEIKLTKENIKIKGHQDFFDGCPSIENKNNVVKFDSIMQKFTNDMKFDGESQKIKDNNNGNSKIYM